MKQVKIQDMKLRFKRDFP